METPALEHLLGAYFHLDWYYEHGDEWANVDDFIAGAPSLVGQLPGEISEVLDAYPDEADLKAYLLSLGSCYTTDAAGGYRGWLSEIARRVSQAVGQPHTT